MWLLIPGPQWDSFRNKLEAGACEVSKLYTSFICLFICALNKNYKKGVMRTYHCKTYTSLKFILNFWLIMNLINLILKKIYNVNQINVSIKWHKYTLYIFFKIREMMWKKNVPEKKRFKVFLKATIHYIFFHFFLSNNDKLLMGNARVKQKSFLLNLMWSLSRYTMYVIQWYTCCVK